MKSKAHEAVNVLTVANEIARQIGARAFFMMGTRHKLGDAYSLTFDIRGCAKWNKIKVTLYLVTDTYILEFFKCGRLNVIRHETHNNISGDRIAEIIEAVTGLALSL